jgi:hypothetical protein
MDKRRRQRRISLRLLLFLMIRMAFEGHVGNKIRLAI